MKIFILSSPKWYSHLSKTQLQESLNMLNERTSKTNDLLEEYFLAKRVPLRKPNQGELDSYKQFVELVINRKLKSFLTK